MPDVYQTEFETSSRSLIGGKKLSFIGAKFFAAHYAAVKREPGSPMALRALRLREAMGYRGRGGGSAFAMRLGISPQRWNNIERGVPFGTELLILLVNEFPGLTTDWLLRGKTEGLTVKMHQTLEAGKESTEQAS